MKKLAVTCFLSALIVIWLTASSYAEDGPAKKFGRGMVNMTTGLIELFNTMNDGWNRNHSVTECAASIPEGMVKSGLRTALGLYEALTFGVPIPKGYEPVITPEFAEFPSTSPQRVVLRKRRKR